MRVFLLCWLGLVVVARAEVRVFVQEVAGLAVLQYECTDGEMVRGFAVDAVVDRGVIVGVSGFFRGESRSDARGYGIFPASFRAHLAASANSHVDWMLSEYTPLADPADHPEDTLPGLGTFGVTLELAALWDPRVPAAAPGPSGTLCALHLSEAARVSVTANRSRGGVVGASTEGSLRPAFSGAHVTPSPSIRGLTVTGEKLWIEFQGGELEHAESLAGPWQATGGDRGVFEDSIQSRRAGFYRVRRP